MCMSIFLLQVTGHWELIFSVHSLTIMYISCLVKSLLNRHSKSIDTFSENHISLRVRGAPMLHPHYAHWFESRRVNAGRWWLDAALVDILAILALDQAYNFRCFPADKSMRKH